MKKEKWLIKKGVLIILLTLLLTNCDKDSTGPEDLSESAVARKEVEVITEFAAVKQSVTYDILKIFSGNYTHKLFKGGDLTKEQIDEIFAKMAKLKEYEAEVNSATNQLLYKAQLNKAGNIKSISGLGDAMNGFFSWISGSGQRSRNRILTVATNMNEGDRTKLYNSLRPEWKAKTNGESDFWQKFEKGDFDTQAPQMYNDFYHNADTEFPDLAQEKGLTIQKIVHKEGAEGVEKGGKLMVEVVKTVTPLGEGMDMVEKADEYKEKIENLYNDPSNTIKEEVKSAIANKIGGFIDIDGAVDAGNLSQDAASAIKFITDYTLGSDDPAEWIKKAGEYGLGKILDSDEKGGKSDVVIATKKTDDNNGPSVVISINPQDIKDAVDHVIDVILTKGSWIFAPFDTDGNNDKVEVDIEEGVGTIVVISTDPTGEHNKGNYALSVWASPADPGTYEDVTVYSKVSPAVPNIAIYFSIVGTDSYAKEETKSTDASGQATFTIPGGAEGVRDNVTIRIVETGLTRTISYVF